MAQRKFDPSVIPKYSVLLLPYTVSDDDYVKNNFFVVLGHKELSDSGTCVAFVIKATSQIKAYQNNPDRLRGVVFYKSGEVECFRKDTVITPENLTLLPHETIADAYFDNILERCPPLRDFEERLTKAIQQSITLSSKDKHRLRSILADTCS